MTAVGTSGAPCWVELFTRDTDRAAAFYGDLFGWTATEPDPAYGGCRSLLRAGEPVAGLMASDEVPEGARGTWTVYIGTTDLPASLARVRAAGGTVLVDALAVGDLGEMAVVVDPAGAAVGLWRPGRHAGLATVGDVGTPGWFETLSTDYAASVAFYREALGWDVHPMSDSDDFRYATLGAGEEARAGIMDASAFLGPSGSRWQFYVVVEDAHDVVTQAVALGGRVTQPVTDTPYGEMAALLDSSGAPFHVIGRLA